MEGVNHAAGTVGGTEGAFVGVLDAVPEGEVGAFLFGQAADDVGIEVNADGTGQAQGFAVRERRRLKGIPGEDEPRGARVQLGAACLWVSCSKRQRFTSRRAAFKASSGETAG